MLDTDVDQLAELIARRAEPLPEIDEERFGAMFAREDETYPLGL